MRKDVACCRNCGHVTCYKLNKKYYECMNGNVVKPEMVCDRFQKNITPAEIIKRAEKEIQRLEQFEDGRYELKKYPPVGQNYRAAVY